MKLKIRYIFLCFLPLLFMACDSFIYEDQDEIDKQTKGQEVYLSVTRAQAADTETINKDAADYEDRVHDLSLLVFDSYTGEKVCEYFDEGIPFTETEKTFNVKMTIGQRDFYFVANMPVAELSIIKDRSEMIAYMSKFRDLHISLYKGATVDKGFPMSRIYLNQTVSEGGNIYQPKPFRPVVNGTEETRVRLIRSVAKLEVVIDGASASSGVKDIYFKNAYRQFSLLPEVYPDPATVWYYEDIPLKKVGNSYLCYMPEAMMVTPSWSPSWWSTTDHKPINYFLIETLDGHHYEIPIITDNRTITATDYLAFATGQNTDKPHYNIYRNRRYYYVIKKLQTIEVIYTIDPWTVKTSTTYMGYGYNVSVDNDGNLTISNTVEVCDPHHVTLTAINGCTFSDTELTKEFIKTSPTDKENYTLINIPPSGNYMEVRYNGILVKTFSKKEN